MDLYDVFTSFIFFFFKFCPASSPVIYFQLVFIIQTEGSKMSVCPSLVFVFVVVVFSTWAMSRDSSSNACLMLVYVCFIHFCVRADFVDVT